MKKKPDIRRIFVFFGIIIVLSTAAILFAYGFRLRSEYKHAFIDAKNIELTLRLIAFDFYKENRMIYDSSKTDGLAEGVVDEVKFLSGAQGLVTLGYWDNARQAAGSFVYKKDNYIVFYEYDKKRNRESWSIYYRIYTLNNSDERL